ncbi:cell surface glycoprotein CD200 receptor 1-B-like [Chroicocephalus ridibundus]|uniref:cell surface glycoprotein CD200 receptor 1-B-like n=1 Tax=Chroicocephalus ridibundus TaxID=1192867 RepID=UPI002FDCA318
MQQPDLIEIGGESSNRKTTLAGDDARNHAGHKRVSVTVGNSSVLICSPKPNMTMATWKINPKAGGPCSLGYRADQNKTDRTNCSESINWKFRPDQDPTLEIQQVGRAHEGSYTCEVVVAEGIFHTSYYLTVLVPPRLTLYCDDQGNPVCEAAAGKPAAQISWVLENNSTPKEEGHDDGTVTVLSKFTAYSTNGTTCIVSHLAGNWSKSIACHPTKSSTRFLHCVISLASLLSLLFLLAVLHLYTFWDSRTMRKQYKPRPLPSAELSGPRSNSAPEQ